MGKGRRSQIRHGDTLNGCRIVEHVAGDHDPCDKAHDYRVPEDSRHGYIGLLAGLFLRGCGSNRRGSDTGLVGKKPSRNAVTNGMLEKSPRDTAGKRCNAESILQDQKAGGRNLSVKEQQQKKAAKQIYDTDSGNHALTQRADLTDTAEDHTAGQDGEKDSGEMRRDVKSTVYGLCRTVGLCRTADPEGCRQRADSVDTAEKGASNTIFQHIHRPTDKGSVLLTGAVQDTQVTFAVSGSHAKDTGDPAPEDSTGPTECHCGGHTDDIACSECGGKGGRQGGERRESGDGGILFSKGKADGIQKPALWKVQMTGKIKMGAHKKNDQGNSPQKVVYFFKNLHGRCPVRWIYSNI